MAATELVLLTPLALAVLGFLVLAGRLSTVRADVAAASRDAARAASLQRSYPDAVNAAQTTASASLAGRHVTCADLAVTVSDTASFVAGGEVDVTVSCVVSLADVALPGIAGTRRVQAEAAEVLDRWRAGP
jgi:Flp pilus assembly protein TadG